jgi:hypothetical protein
MSIMSGAVLGLAVVGFCLVLISLAIPELNAYAFSGFIIAYFIGGVTIAVGFTWLRRELLSDVMPPNTRVMPTGFLEGVASAIDIAGVYGPSRRDLKVGNDWLALSGDWARVGADLDRTYAATLGELRAELLADARARDAQRVVRPARSRVP